MRIIYKTNTTYSAAEFGKMNLEIQKHDSKFRKAQYIIAAIIAVIIAICLYNAWYIAAVAMVGYFYMSFRITCGSRRKRNLPRAVWKAPPAT